jgi:hypothetical protein
VSHCTSPAAVDVDGADVADVADGEDCCSADDAVVAGMVEDCSSKDEDEDEEEDACNTMRCSKDSQKVVVLVSSRRKSAASKSRLHVWTFGGKRQMLSSSGTSPGADNEDDELDAAMADAAAIVGVVVVCKVPVTRSI